MVYMTMGQIQHYTRHRESKVSDSDLKFPKIAKEDFDKYVTISFDKQGRVKDSNLEKELD